MNPSLSPQRHAQIRNAWQQRDTEDLLAVWQAPDRSEWTPETFAVIGELLTERLGELPSQTVAPLTQAEELLAAAQAHEAKGNFAAALTACEAALKKAPNLATLHHYRGLLLDTLGQLAPAIAAYQTALHLDPNFAEAQADLAAAQADWAALGSETPPLVEAAALDEVLEDLPPDLYLSPAALTVRGWPGNRSRPERSGYDPLDTDFENAHVTGLLMRQLFTGTLRIHNPLLWPVAILFGLLAIMPLIFSFGEFLNGYNRRLWLLLPLSLYWLPGLALLWNVVRNIYDSLDPLLEEADDEANPTEADPEDDAP